MAIRKNVYTVSQVNAYVKNMFTQDYICRSLLVKGEVSNCKYHSSGHIYFTLKDAGGAINCVMFAGYRSGLSFRLLEGQQVIAGGTLDVYERDGKYQLYVKQILLDGAGRLYEQFEQLKRELEEMGMFSPEYKRPIPKYIRTLGVVTADTGAAVRDIIQITRRRNPYVQILLYPAIVQGETAAESIVKGSHALERKGVDVMIVGRGGGSMEDLWAFNERIVAQAAFDCSVPIISAVGHETDTTILDYVADLRAPTPSAAAELAVADIRLVFERFQGYGEHLRRLMNRQISVQRGRLAQCERHLKLLSPSGRIREQKMRCAQMEDRLSLLMERILEDRRHRLDLYIEKMKGLSPLEKLSSGYSYVEDDAGRNIRSIEQVCPGDRLKIRVRDGRIDAVATGTGKVEDAGNE